MKALIIYDNFVSAARASAMPHHSAQFRSVGVSWNVVPWRLDVMKFPPTAEESLTEAMDAHLIVFAGHFAQWVPSWLQNWLEHWAKCRRIRDAALAVIRAAGTNSSSNSMSPELSCAS